ncbi:XrtA/PEP-CTERM system histidine kinase PrsK [Sandarakinorhabdus sp. AAP62]|uniref:XrtA/PEP-CTERM system histidine kinase PrsK n=1 Tax=Sandarakinorhabdus sp. AAP62 TaxID=1248916 RepID=UPI0002F029EF|nr:XrtA/PEP-CTERM system histidine kinase PrsK [Sandarakinorhabdus sp. AAP62]
MIALTEVGLLSHLLALIAYLGLFVAALTKQRRGLNLWLGGAALVTALWAASFVASILIDQSLQPWISRLQTVKVGVWISVLLYLLRPTWLGGEGEGRSSFWVGGILGFVLTLQFFIDVAGAGQGALIGKGDVAASLFLVIRIAVSVTGLVLSHNLYIASRSGQLSGIRLLAIGLAGLFLYDLNFYTLAFLLPPASIDLYNIRGAVNALLVLLFLFATRDAWVTGARVSRNVAFQTVAFSGVGFYLIAMSLLAYALKLMGGNWGTLLQVSFMFATIMLGAVVLVSDRFRAWLRVAIARNFYRYRYDYRSEWLRFIATVSAPGDAQGLPERVVQAVASVLEARGGWLLVPDDDRLSPGATWQMADRPPEVLAMDSPLVDWLRQDRLLDLEMVRDGELPDAPELPTWLAADRRYWLVLPAFNRDALAGVLLIGRSLVPRRLGWEDEELLKTLGRQVGSYVAESRGQSALDEARRFEEFNRRFAFILHDIKNLVSQLSLLARNAERHADNPEFRADMVATLKESVGKMNALLSWLSQRATGMPAADAPVPVASLLGLLVKSRAGAWPALSLNLGLKADQAMVSGDAARLEQMFAHLLQNAIDASPAGAPIRFDVAVAGNDLVVTLSDRGQGMSARFIRQELFQPFTSTKPGGFGIGAYEAREIARAHGGRLDVASREGEGTSFSITLPLAGTGAGGVAAGEPALLVQGGQK